MDSLGSILPKVLHKRGLYRHAQAALVTHKAALWLKAALPSFTEQLRVGTFTDGVLTIASTHSIAAQECQGFLPELTEFLNRECDGAAVRQIRMMRSR